MVSAQLRRAVFAFCLFCSSLALGAERGSVATIDFNGVFNPVAAVASGQDVVVVGDSQQDSTAATSMLFIAEGGAGSQVVLSARGASAAALLSDGGFAVVGSTFDSQLLPVAWVVRTDKAGKVLWSRNVSGRRGIIADSVEVTPNDEIVLGGYFFRGGALLVKFAPSGQQLLALALAAHDDLTDLMNQGKEPDDNPDSSTVRALARLKDGQMIVAVDNMPAAGAAIASIDARGQTRDQVSFEDDVRIDSLAADGDGVLVSGTVGQGVETAAWCGRVKKGKLEWSLVFDSDGHDFNTSVVSTADGIVLAGRTNRFKPTQSTVLWFAKIGRDRRTFSSIAFSGAKAGSLAGQNERIAMVSAGQGAIAFSSEASDSGQRKMMYRLPGLTTPDCARFIEFKLAAKGSIAVKTAPYLQSSTAAVVVTELTATNRSTAGPALKPECALSEKPLQIATLPGNDSLAGASTQGSSVLQPGQATAGESRNDKLEVLADAEAEFEKKVVFLITARRFEEASKLHAELLRTHEKFNAGVPKLGIFYNAFYSPMGWFSFSDDQQATLIEEWQRAERSSVAPRIAMAEIALSRFWRLSKTCSTDPSATAQMRSALAALQKFGNGGDPEYYVVSMQLAEAMCNLEEIPPLLQEGMKVDPSYMDLYRTASNRLRTAWGGRDHDLFEFADRISKQLPHELGEEMFGRIAREATMSEGPVLFTRLGFPWDRVRDAELTIQRLYPNSSRNLHWFARLSYLAGDLKSLKAAWQAGADVRTNDAAQIWRPGEYEAAKKQVEGH